METNKISIGFLDTDTQNIAVWHIKNELKHRLQGRSIDNFIFCASPFDARQKEERIIFPNYPENKLIDVRFDVEKTLLKGLVCWFFISNI